MPWRKALGVVMLAWMGAASLFCNAWAAPAIDWTRCPSGQDDGARGALHCGWLETGQRLAGRPVYLRLARLQKHSAEPTSHPVIFIPGGPGDSAGLQPRALQRWRQFRHEAGWPADLVVYDPRGTGQSTPRFACPPAQDPDSAAGLAQCFHKLGPKVVNGLGIAAQIADLRALIESLGQGPPILWARSYGAVIARRLVAEHPEEVRSLILESPLLEPQPLGRRNKQVFARRRAQIIRDCWHRLTCRLAVPSAPALLDGMIDAFDQAPLHPSLAEPPWKARDVTLDAHAMRAFLLLSSYGKGRNEPFVSVLRHALLNTDGFVALTKSLVAFETQESGMAPVYWSTRCQLAPPAAAHGGAAYKKCRVWPVSRLPPTTNLRFVPTLVLSGERDVLTPAAAAAGFVLAHPGRQWVPVAGAGHGVLFASACARRTVRHFIATGGAWIGVTRCRVADTEAAARP